MTFTAFYQTHPNNQGVSDLLKDGRRPRAGELRRIAGECKISPRSATTPSFYSEANL
jgi:hypothetical protein